MTLVGSDHSKQLGRGSFYFLIGQAAPALVAIVSIPIVANRLGPEMFGLYTLLLAIIAYGVALDFGIGPGLTKLLAGALVDPEEKHAGSLFWTSLALLGIAGLFIFTILWFLGPVLIHRGFGKDPGIETVGIAAIRVVAVLTPIHLLQVVSSESLRAAHRFGLVNLLNAPLNIGQHVVAAAGVLFDYSIPAIFSGFIVLRSIGLLATLVTAMVQIPVLRSPSLRSLDAKRLMRYSKWVLLGILAEPLISNLDRIVLGLQGSLTSLGFYAAPYALITKMTLVPLSIAAVLLPIFSRAHNQGDHLRAQRIYWGSLKFIVLAMGGACILAGAYIREILQIWIGSEYARLGAWIALALLPGVFVNSLAHIPFAALRGYHRPQTITLIYLGEVVFYIPAMMVAVSVWGPIGAAITWSIRVVVDAMLIGFFATRLLGGGWQAVRNAFLRPGLLGAGLMLLAFGRWFVPVEYAWIGHLGFVMGIFAVLWLAWHWALGQEERDMAWKIVGRVNKNQSA